MNHPMKKPPRYRSANDFLQEQFGGKIYKLSLNGGFTCPNRDGTCGTEGCIFCNAGSSDFTVRADGAPRTSVELAKQYVSSKIRTNRYIAYFQSYSGTYAAPSELRSLYRPFLALPEIVGLDIATRPDCLGDDVMEVLCELNSVKPVWIELGLQTANEKTAEYIRRGYPLSVFDSAVKKLKAAGIYTIVHMIIGLPGETPEKIYETVSHIADSGAGGIKLQLLHVLKNTDLAREYAQGTFEILSLEDYIRILEGCIRRLPPEMTIHRLTGDGPKKDLIAPLWSADKKRVLNAIRDAMERDDVIQGALYGKNGSPEVQE